VRVSKRRRRPKHKRYTTPSASRSSSCAAPSNGGHSFDFARSFHDYSLNNLLLTLSQKPEATHVAGFRKWQELGRQVREGETGIRIFGYSTKKITEEDDNGDEAEKRTIRSPVLTVFDISQTDLIDDAADPTGPAHQLTGTAGLAIGQRARWRSERPPPCSTTGSRQAVGASAVRRLTPETAWSSG
jgi:hypothetical protein